MARRKELLVQSMNELDDAILYGSTHTKDDLSKAREMLEKIQQAYDQGTWGLAEKFLKKAERFRGEPWYAGFLEKRARGAGPEKRFESDGLCGKYGHQMVKIKLSNLRWYYQCTWCRKKGKSASIK